MSYYDVITNVERRIEREQAYMELHRDGLFCSENWLCEKCCSGYGKKWEFYDGNFI